MAAPLSDMEIGGALLSTRGNVELAAQKLGCCRHTIYDRMKKNKAIGAARVAGRVMMVDAAEDKLFEAITAGKGWAILFALKTVGRDRGYVERQEMEHTGTVTWKEVIESAGSQDLHE